MLRPQVWVSVCSLAVFVVILVIGAWVVKRPSRHQHDEYFGPHPKSTNATKALETEHPIGINPQTEGSNNEATTKAALNRYKQALDSLVNLKLEPGRGEAQIYHANKLPSTPELDSFMSMLESLPQGDYELLVRELMKDISVTPNEQTNAKFILAYRMLELADQRGIALGELPALAVSLAASREPASCLFASIVGRFYGTPSIASALQDSLIHMSDGWQRDYAHIQVIKALGRCGGEQSLNALIEFSRSDDSKRWYVANAIMDLADPEKSLLSILAIVKQSNDAGFIPLERMIKMLAASAAGTTQLLQTAREETNTAARKLLLEAWCLADADPRSTGLGPYRPFMEGLFKEETDPDVRLLAFRSLVSSGTPMQRIEAVIQARGRVVQDAWAQRLIETMPLSIRNGLGGTLAEGITSANRQQLGSILTQLANYTIERRSIQTDPAYEVLRRALVDAISNDDGLSSQWSQLR